MTNMKSKVLICIALCVLTIGGCGETPSSNNSYSAERQQNDSSTEESKNEDKSDSVDTGTVNNPEQETEDVEMPKSINFEIPFTSIRFRDSAEKVEKVYGDDLIKIHQEDMPEYYWYQGKCEFMGINGDLTIDFDETKAIDGVVKISWGCEYSSDEEKAKIDEYVNEIYAIFGPGAQSGISKNDRTWDTNPYTIMFYSDDHFNINFADLEYINSHRKPADDNQIEKNSTVEEQEDDSIDIVDDENVYGAGSKISGTVEKRDHKQDPNTGGYDYTYYVLCFDKPAKIALLGDDDEIVEVEEFTEIALNVDSTTEEGKKIEDKVGKEITVEIKFAAYTHDGEPILVFNSVD